jgi:23S rRNA (pseudouridine1915-N3)-methyltransferase
MKLRIVALGHRMPAWVAAGYDDYRRRLPRDFAFDLVELKPEPREKRRSVAQVLAAEASRIQAACAGYRAIALDERGAPWTTREFADRLRKWRDDAESVAFVIGSADGLAADVKARAMAVLAVSAMTLPHGLVRVLLVEQVYRAASLLAGHPYHRE